MADGTDMQLVTIQPNDALAVFTTPAKIDPILDRIRQEIDAFVPDLSTKRGRDNIASIAYRVARSKTYLDGIGKQLADDQKEVPKKIDASRKRIRDTLDKWRAEKREAEAAELARLRAEAAARELAEREAKAKADADERERKAAEAAAAAERAKAEAAISAAKADAERKDREHKAELEAVERRAIEAAAKAKADTELAAMRVAAETAKREADREHRGRINRAALAAFVEYGVDEDTAKQVITLIAAGSIPSIKISY